MATKLKSLFYNFILIGVVVVLCLLAGTGGSRLTAISLDQQTRCTLPEHVHTETCYMGELLLCNQKAHLHNNNCYLVLLQDNDINWLLENVDLEENRSLEGVINSAMVQALRLNQNFRDPNTPVELTSQDIAQLNAVIVENHIEPAVVLNEDLDASKTLTYSVEDTKAGTTVTPSAVGGTPATGRVVNFYAMLDGNLVFVNSAALVSSNPEYITYANAAKAYTGELTTGLSTSTINSAYFFRYNTSGQTGSASNFTSNATYRSSRVRFANSNYAQYALLCERTNSGGSYTYRPVEFFTVGLDYSAVDPSMDVTVRRVEKNKASGLTLSDEYLWYDAAGNLVTAMPNTITETTILYARPKAFTATFLDANRTQVAEPYGEKPVDGKVSVQLPDLTGTLWEGYYWIFDGTDGTTYYPSDGSATVEITGDTVFMAVAPDYVVSFMDEKGNGHVILVPYLEKTTLPSLPDGWYWQDQEGRKYQPGSQSDPIRTDMLFTAKEQMLTVHYDVNFPAGAVSAVDEVPTIYGTEEATVTDYAVGGRPVITRNLTSRTARDEVSTSNKESVTYFFKGWTVPGTGLLIPPDSTLTWNDLSPYIDENNEVSLEGVWDSGDRYNSATFFLRFDSAAVDTDGNITSQPVENYTPEIFNTHVGGVDRSLSDSQIKQNYEIADTTSDNSFGADQKIRALYGETAEGIWFYDFPSDDHVFDYLKNYLASNPGRSLTVDGEPVDPAQLNHDYYAIRWYVFKLEGSSWHIDGKLVKKEGNITVTKNFGGSEDILSDIKDGFYMVAENGTRDENGVFTAYSSSDSRHKEHLLVPDAATGNALRAQYPGATVTVADGAVSTDRLMQWDIPNIELGEHWQIREYLVELEHYSCYPEYSVYDTDGAYTAIAEYGTVASVVGKTFALDEDPDQGMLTIFSNYYYPKEAILIKKEDAKTGRPIGGAVFELWQNDVLLSFNYQEQTGQYERDPEGDGAFSQIVTSADGFSIISTTGFSYDYGDVVVKEVLPPAGYDPAPNITVGRNDDGDVVLKDVLDTDPDRWPELAEVPSEDVLVVKDHTAEYISVTVNKVWNTNTPADSVEVVLQANGQHAAALFPGMKDAQVVLSAGNVWAHTWYDLPRFANGQMVQWGVKEIVIGGKPTLSDGVTFANWIVTYSPGYGTDADSDGDIDSWSFTITNSTRRLQMIVTKVGTDGAMLPGSVFSLEQVELVNGQWVPVSGTMTNVQTTDANSMLTFDNLTADVYYRFAELSATDGYFIGFEPVVLTMDGNGNIRKVLADGSFAQLNDPLVQITRPYNIQVINLKMAPLPQSGGEGIMVYLQSGTALLVAAAALLLYNINRRRKRKGVS